MTLKQVYQRIKAIVQAHKQIRTYKRGLVTDELVEKTTKYPAGFLTDKGGAISISGKQTTMNFSLTFLDLVHVSEDTDANNEDVLSDMLSVAEDIITQLNNPNYLGTWRIGLENIVDLLVENDNDMSAGVTVNFSVSFMFKQNLCAVPSELVFDAGDETTSGGTVLSKAIFDTVYVADGSEGSTLTIEALAGKKILFITRESSPVYKTSASPDESEYTWDLTDLVFGAPIGIGERILILYRNF